MKKLNWLVILAVVLIPAALSLACPMCKDSIPNSDAQAAVGLPGGFNTSVYLMLIGFFACLGIMSFVITRGVISTNHTRIVPKDPQSSSRS